MTVDDWANLPLDGVIGPGGLTKSAAFGQKQYYLDAELGLYLLGGGNGCPFRESHVGGQSAADAAPRSLAGV
jgi:hypothetical protein